MTQLEFVLPEEAIALSEIGFDEPCLNHQERGVDGYGWGLFTSGSYLIKKDLVPLYHDKDGNICGEFSAPSYSQAFRWFRKKHEWNFSIIQCDPSLCDNKIMWLYRVSLISKKDYIGNESRDFFKTYEEAELACLKKMIEIVKNKKE